MNPGVVVVKKVGILRIVGVVALCLAIFWHYFVAPAVRALDSVTPWEGALPFSPISCGGSAPAVPEVTGFPAMFHDLGTGVRSLASGPPSAQQIKGWLHEAGESGAMAVYFASGGLEGKPKPLGLAPLPLPAAPLAVAGPGRLSEPQIAALAVEVGWPAAEVPNVVARVMAESSGDPLARDYADGTHHGLLQLGTAEQARYMDPGTSAFDPKENLRGALRLHRERGWQPWAASDSAVAVACPAPVAPQGTWVNGYLPDAALVAMPGGQRLRSDAATAFHALSAAYAQVFGEPLTVGSGYRSFDEQAALKRIKPVLAAGAGKSQHGLGLAADINGPGARFGTREHEWLRVHAGQFGWFHPSWAQRGGSKPEPWHWEYAEAASAGRVLQAG